MNTTSIVVPEPLAGVHLKAAARILSLDPQFEYMRKPMCMKADAFIYPFDITDITGKSLAYLHPYVSEVRDMYRHGLPEILVGSHPDPTITAKPEKTNALVKVWLRSSRGRQSKPGRQRSA